MDVTENRPLPWALSGIAGRIDITSSVEALQERRDRDRARWLGVPIFTRAPTPLEMRLIERVTGRHGPLGVRTRVDVRGGLWRRSWPTLARETGSTPWS